MTQRRQQSAQADSSLDQALFDLHAEVAAGLLDVGHDSVAGLVKEHETLYTEAMDKPSVYIETSIVSYLTARPSRDLRAAAWQQITTQWWTTERLKYGLFTSELVVAEASAGDQEAAAARLEVLAGIGGLPVDHEVRALAAKLIEGGGVPPEAELDALHIAVACVHEIDYLLTWNCRHINNAAVKPIIRSICVAVGYPCSEICTPLELLAEEQNDV